MWTLLSQRSTRQVNRKMFVVSMVVTADQHGGARFFIFSGYWTNLLWV